MSINVGSKILYEEHPAVKTLDISITTNVPLSCSRATVKHTRLAYLYQTHIKTGNSVEESDSLKPCVSMDSITNAFAIQYVCSDNEKCLVHIQLTVPSGYTSHLWRCGV